MKREDEIKCPRLKKSYIASLNLRDEDHPQNVNYDAIENFKGLRKERTCTDMYCFYIFIVMNGLIFSLSGLVLKDINFNRLKYGQDFRGDYCGIKQLVNESYVYWPDPVGWGPNVKACVTRCPASDNEERCLYNEFNTEYASDYCMKTYPTKANKNYCVPSSNLEYRTIVDAQMRSWSNFFISVAVDLVNLKELIAISLGAALVLSMINSALLNVRAAKINKVWFFLSFFVALGAGGYTGFLFYSDIENLKVSECSEASSTDSCARDRTYFLYGAVAFCVLIIFNSILKLLFGFPKLFFNFASMYILGQPIRRFFVFLVPFFFSMIQIMVITTSIVLFSLFMTSGYNINVTTGPDFYMPEVRKTYMTWYAYYGCFLLFFVTYLYVSFFVSVQRTIIATIVSQWYFSKTRDYLRYTCYKGYAVVYKHIGTLFYHSFIIMLIWPLRKFAAFFVHMFNNIKYANGCHMFLIKMCTCCVRFHETRWKYVFSQLIYQTVIFGDDFTIAGIKLYYLRYRNYSRYKGFETQFGIFNYFSTVLVSFVSSLVIYYYVKTTKVSYMGADLSALEFPQLAPIITFFASLFICRGYNNLIDYGNEVMLLCFMADEEMFQGDQRFASENIENYFNLHGTEPERKNMKNIQAQLLIQTPILPSFDFFFGNLSATKSIVGFEFAQAMQKRSVKQEKKKDKKSAKNKKVDPNNPGAEDGNSSEEEMDDQDQAKARGEFIQAKLMQKKKEREELERERAEREKLQEQGIAGKGTKKKIELGGDTVAGAIWKQAQRFAIKTAAEDDQVRIPKKKGADDD